MYEEDIICPKCRQTYRVEWPEDEDFNCDCGETGYWSHYFEEEGQPLYWFWYYDE